MQLINPEEPKRFDNWIPKVECNNCARYWDNTCDGVNCGTNEVNSDKPLQGSTRLCNSFLPTRSIVIQAQIKDLQLRVKRLKRQQLFWGAIIVVHMLIDILGG